MATSHGDAISGYFPNMSGTSGVKSYLTNLKAQVITGTITSANVHYEKSHQLGVAPQAVIVVPLYATDQAKNFTSGVVVGSSAASASTSSKYYVIGNKAGAKYRALLIG